MIIEDDNYCRRCRVSNHVTTSRTNYCGPCSNLIHVDKNAFNKWLNAEVFINTSFKDCVDDSVWNGFTNVKYKKDLIKKIINRFSNLSYINSIERASQFKQTSSYFLYLVRDSQANLLKVGQTCNVSSRFRKYYNISQHKPITMDILSIDMRKQDLYEAKLRNYLEYLGYILPEDNTGQRLKYINC